MLDSLLLHLITFQTIIVNSTTPCWLNNTVSVDIFQCAGFGKDWLTAIISPWVWVTGGWFSMILVAVLVAFTYIKYHKAIYPIIIGSMFLPISYFLFPSQFLIFAFIFAGIGVGILIWYALISQSNEA